MEIKTRVFVIKRDVSGEKDGFFVVFSREYGKLMVKAKSTKKLLSRMQGNIEPFSLNDYVLVRRNGERGVFTLIQAAGISGFSGIRGSIKKMAFFYEAVELIDIFFQLEDENKGMFDTVLKSFEFVEKEDEEKISRAHLFFKTRLLKTAGFDITQNTGFFLNSKTGAQARDCIYEALSSDIAGCAASAQLNEEALKVLDYYITMHADRDIKSRRLLRR
ncbi:MAG: DNA repair protein RecO [Candidatus Goldiibacteriota bacterium]